MSYDDRLRADEWEVRTIPLAECQRLVRLYHYAGGGSNTATARHGLFRKGSETCLGIAWWIPPTKSAALATHPTNWQGVLALSRLVIAPDVPKNACTFLLARSMRLIDRARWPCFVTYADDWQGHTGTIYRAANWTYVGKTAAEATFVKDGRMIARKAGPKTRTRAEMAALGAVCIGAHAKHKFVHIVEGKIGRTMTKNPKHLKTTAEHNTPRAIVEAARRVLGRIDLDPMSNDAAQRVIQARTYYTKEDDCFWHHARHGWEGNTFLNPAGGFVKDAWQALMQSWREEMVTEFVWVGYSLEQLQTLQVDRGRCRRERYDGPTPIEFPICIPYKRLAFEDAEGNPQRSPTHANYIAYGGPHPYRFVCEFGRFGVCTIPHAGGSSPLVAPGPWEITYPPPLPIRDDPDPYFGCPAARS